MTQNLLARVSADFDAAAPQGLVIASEDLDATYGFTELGWDTCNYERAPNVLEIEVTAARLASDEDLDAAAERAGVKVHLTLDEYLETMPEEFRAGYKASCEADGQPFRMRDEGTEANHLLENPLVVAELEAAGFDGYRGVVTVTNEQPELTILWKADAFNVVGPVEVVADDEDQPYDVRVAAAPGLAP